MNEPTSANPPENLWADTWPDALAFALGLGLAWFFQWKTTDLVWSLWLSSLVVGYAMIVWMLSSPLRELLQGMRADTSQIASAAGKGVVILLFSVGTLFGLAFFTVHFGGFHFVHSVFLQQFFPVTNEPIRGLADWSMYAEIFSRYWWFLPVAFIAERHGFRRKASSPDAPETALPKIRMDKGDAMMAPYKNVIRMHMLIFFFAFAHFAQLENIAVYAIVYAVYFFPWRLLRRKNAAVSATS